MVELLRLPYFANILILMPVCIAMLRGIGASAVFEGKTEPSRGLESLVAAIWTTILCLSFAGLLAPREFLPLLLFQVVYKAIWLALYVVPRALRYGFEAIPVGITLSFSAIVAIWPVFIWVGYAYVWG